MTSVPEHRADRAVGVADEGRDLHRRLVLERRHGSCDQIVVERDVEPVILRAHAATRDRGRQLRHVQQRTSRSRPCAFQCVDGRLDVEAVGTADHLVDRPEAELGHQLAHFLRDEAEEVLDELRPPGEHLAQLGILRRDADRARIEVAHAHHDAAHHDERRRREPELFGAEQRAR